MTKRASQKFSALLLAADDPKTVHATNRVMASFWTPRQPITVPVIRLSEHRAARR